MFIVQGRGSDAEEGAGQADGQGVVLELHQA